MKKVILLISLFMYCVFEIKFYIIHVGFPTMTINEFRNKHCGRGGSTHHLHHFQLMGVN